MKSSLSTPSLSHSLLLNKHKLQVGHVEAFSLRFAVASIVTFDKTTRRDVDAGVGGTVT